MCHHRQSATEEKMRNEETNTHRSHISPSIRRGQHRQRKQRQLRVQYRIETNPSFSFQKKFPNFSMNNVARRLITAERNNNVEKMVQMTIKRHNLGSHMHYRTLSTQSPIPPRDSSSATVAPTHLRTSLVSTNTHGTATPEGGPNTTTTSNDEHLISYARGWAWQQTILNRRLEIRRQRQQQQQQNKDSPPHYDDPDVVLMLEHKPVYTLGRGADENHLTFLTNPNENNDDDQDKHDYNQMVRERLSRSSRGIGSARLSVDRQILHAATLPHNPSTTTTTPLPPTTTTEADLHMVQTLSQMAVPVMAPNGCPIYRIERGGEVTWHGPGQLVVYPLLDLTRSPYQQDLHWYLRQIEEVIIQTLHHFGIQGIRDEDDTGVWVKKTCSSSGRSSHHHHNKIAAVGVSSSRWITTHGFAINVCPNLEYFDTSMILPCGIEGKGVTSIMEVLKEHHHHQQQQQQQLNVEQPPLQVPTIEQVAQVTCQSIEKVFGIEIQIDENDKCSLV